MSDLKQAPKLTTKRGQTDYWDFAITNAGVAVDLSTAVVRAYWKRTLDDEEPTLTKTSADGGIEITDAAAGEVRLHFSPTDSATTLADCDSWLWDLWIELNGDHFPVYEPGVFLVTRGVGR